MSAIYPGHILAADIHSIMERLSITQNLQKELSAELALRTRQERSKQEEVRGSGETPERGRAAVGGGGGGGPPGPPPPSGGGGGVARRRPVSHHARSNHPNAAHPSHPSHHSAAHPRGISKHQRNKKEKLLCLCQTPYDDTK